MISCIWQNDVVTCICDIYCYRRPLDGLALQILADRHCRHHVLFFSFHPYSRIIAHVFSTLIQVIQLLKISYRILFVKHFATLFLTAQDIYREDHAREFILLIAIISLLLPGLTPAQTPGADPQLEVMIVIGTRGAEQALPGIFKSISI